MKFGKEFTSQMVPEWQEAYMNYNYLKTFLKEILLFRQKNKSSPLHPSPRRAKMYKRNSLYRAFSGLTNPHGHNSDMGNDHIEVISVSEIQIEEQQSEFSKYETMFLLSPKEGVESELVFFRKLDDEFNKVISFYRCKVEEVVMEAEELNKQMDALVALRIKINDPHFDISSTPRSSGNPQHYAY